MDAMRIPVGTDTTTATVAQVRRLTSVTCRILRTGSDHTRQRPACSSSTPATTRSRSAPASPILAPPLVVRIRADRVFYPDPGPATPGTIGRPRRHGHPFSAPIPPTWPAPDAELHTQDARYGAVHVQAWHGLHPRLVGRRWAWATRPPRSCRGSVIRVDVEHLPKPTRRTNKTLWLWAAGPGLPDLDMCWRAYLRRFDIEHTFRFGKNTLGWTTPSVQTPEQADRWTWLIIAAYTQLRLARRARRRRATAMGTTRHARQLTPARVRQGVSSTSRDTRHTSHPPKPTNPAPGARKEPAEPPNPLPGNKEGRLNTACQGLIAS